jgi:hypothetical protein
MDDFDSTKCRFWKLLLFFLICSSLLVSDGVSFSQAGTVDLNALTQETQKTSRKNDELLLLWWIPEEFWSASLSQSADMSSTQAEEFLKVLRPYFVLVVVDGQMGPIGGLTFRPEATVRESVQLVDASGKRYRPLNNDSLGGDIRNLLQMFKPILGNMLGPIGQNMHFLLFPARDSKGLMIAEAKKEGGFSVQLRNAEYKWRLPLGSLLPTKTCPVDGEQLSGAWTFCPWHGVRLVSAPGSEQKVIPK